MGIVHMFGRCTYRVLVGIHRWVGYVSLGDVCVDVVNYGTILWGWGR
jgi:hypothetical protein